VTGRRRANRRTPEIQTMKADIHPSYGKMTATCSCGNVIETGSTLAKDVHLDVCFKCHPFFSGKQKVLDAGGRIDRFKKRFGAVGARR
jgi:large subunit ribosomal protein L31